MATSFKKKTSSRGRGNLPPGVRPSLNNNQLLVSTGCPSLDTLLGGGLALGTLMLVAEDAHQSYTNALRKLFIGEGVVCGHSLFLAASPGEDAASVVQGIPRDVNAPSEKEESGKKDESNDLQIAWRYKNQPKVDAGISHHTQFGHYFDLSTTLSEEKVASLDCSTFTPQSQDLDTMQQGVKVAYKKLLKSIAEKLEANKLFTDSSSNDVPGVLRIQIPSLGSPMWREDLITASSDSYTPSLAWFLLALRSLLRRSYCVAMVSVPVHLFEETHFVHRVQRCADVVVRLESFAGCPDKSQNPLFKEYHGLFHVRKAPHVNSICGSLVDTSDLAFKLKKRKFLIEKLHLPPDISETASRSNAVKPGVPLCSATTPVNNLLDF